MGAKRKTRCARLGSFVLGLALSLSVLAAVQLAGAEPAQARYASIVIDADTGEVLRARNADTLRYPASLTKMMTLYLLFEAIENGRLSLDSRFKVSERAARQPASKLWLKAGSTIRVEDAIKSLIVKSANDVAVVVAEALGGTEKKFATRMTEKAHALGMSRTTFRNASGLPNQAQRSTARDMGRLARALMRDFPHRYHYFDDQRFRYGGRVHRTPNRLLGNYSGMDGIKTGYIHASGFNLVASAERDGRRVIAVVFGGKTSRSRNAHVSNLLDLGFTRLASRRPARSRILVAGIPRPPSASGLAAPAPRQKPAPGQRPAPLQVAAAELAPPVEGAAAPPSEPAEIAEAGPLPPLPPSRPAPVHATPAGKPEAPETRVASLAVDGPWGIQVGSYDSVTAAEIAMRRASARAPLLTRAAATLAPSGVGSGTLYRARFLGLYKNDANRACKTLRAAPMPCIIIRSLDPSLDPAVSTTS